MGGGTSSSFSTSAQYHPQSLFGGGREMGPDLVEYLRPGLHRGGGVHPAPQSASGVVYSAWGQP